MMTLEQVIERIKNAPRSMFGMPKGVGVNEVLGALDDVAARLQALEKAAAPKEAKKK